MGRDDYPKGVVWPDDWSEQSKIEADGSSHRFKSFSVAIAAGYTKPRDAAEWVARRILRRLSGKKSEKLRNWTFQRNYYEPWAAAASSPSRDLALHWVKLELASRENAAR